MSRLGEELQRIADALGCLHPSRLLLWSHEPRGIQIASSPELILYYRLGGYAGERRGDRDRRRRQQRIRNIAP